MRLSELSLEFPRECFSMKFQFGPRSGLLVQIEISKVGGQILSHNSCLIFSKPFPSLTKSVLTAQNGNY